MIMFPNGVSHTLVENHLEGIVAMLTWLSYVPSVRRGFLPIQDITGVDVVERAISFTPQKGIAYDPRYVFSPFFPSLPPFLPPSLPLWLVVMWTLFHPSPPSPAT